MFLDVEEMKSYIEKEGIKQRAISKKTGIPEVRLCLILNRKRKCETGEYASICDALGVPLTKFVSKNEEKEAG